MFHAHPIDRRTFLAGIGGSALFLTTHGGTSRSSAPRHIRSRARSLADAIRGHVFAPGQPGYLDAAHVYNTRFNGARPIAVARPLDAIDVRDAIRWALATGTRVRARSGGHSYAGYSTLTDGVVLDVRELNGVRLDRRAGTATVGAGA